MSEEDDRSERASEGDDASFEDGFKPTRLVARDAADLEVFSALLQDAVVLVKETAWLKAERRFAMVAARYRWEEPGERERVRTGVHFDNVVSVRAKGVDLSAGDAPFVILAVTFEPADEAPGGLLRIACANAAEIQLDVEAFEAAMADVSKPWKARRTPRHIGG